MTLLFQLFSALSWLAITAAGASNNTSSSGMTSDPYLLYKPEFARSLPVQVLVTGAVLTLTCVLLIHIIFTGQYHWPLAPVNYALQLSAVLTLLISLIATIHVIFSATISESQHWPYMLNYMAVTVPPLDVLFMRYSDSINSIPPSHAWSEAERGTWLLMNSAVSALAQMTHIQFLTLLYPSKLECRLIFFLLGPLSVLSSVMQLIPIQSNPTLNDHADEIRNICNATLSLLFTASLYIWGLLVNRRNAWRTDGGTAIFGAGALILTLVSTALNFLYVQKSQEYVWLPGLIWSVILWQSFLGWWWWVGSGQSSEDLYESVLKHDEKERKRKKRKRAQAVNDADSSGEKSDDRSSYSDDSSSVQRQHRAALVNSRVYRLLPKSIQSWYRSIRQAHVHATRAQLVEKDTRIREIQRSSGWGIGSFLPRRRRDIGEFEMESRDGRNETFSESWASEEQEPSNSIPSTATLPNPGNPSLRSRNQGSEGAGESRGRSILWWGPLNRWRLQDSTAYR